MKLKLTIIISMFFVGYAIGCSSDLECPMGSSCLQPAGSWSQGICSGSNGFGQVQVPAYLPQQQVPNTFAQQCTTNFQCGFGRSCVKFDGYYGTCQ